MNRFLNIHKLPAVIVWVLILLCALLAFTPVSMARTRELHLITVLALLIVIGMKLATYLRPRRGESFAVIALLLIASVYAATGGKPADTDRLRQTYLSTLMSYQGSRYVWGGESKLGIDCSGLARTAFWQAMAKEGIKEHNPRLLGPTLWKFWWHDLSANAMFGQAWGYTRPIGHAKKLSIENGIEMRPGFKLEVGDLGVTDSRAHVMIYIGNGKWIEANPADEKVVANKTVNSDRGYFNTPVTIMRWWLL